LERALAMARENLEDARRSVLDLRGASRLEGKPLAEALAGLARSFTSDSGVPVHVAATATQRLPLRIEAELFRVAQEALTNVRKHAHASEVDLALRRRGSTLTLSVRDDGRGFSPRAHRSDGLSHGIVGMRERAKLLGGRLQISSAPGKGSRIVARVPLTAEEETKP
jgi:two-component system, NarL family, sensor kinase